MAGNLERSAAIQPHTRQGFLGAQLNGNGLGGVLTYDLLTDNGHSFGVEDQTTPNRKNVSLIPLAPVELGRFLGIDATLGMLSLPVVTPSLPQHLAVIVQEVYFVAAAISGLTSHPTFSLGFNGPAFSNVIPAMALSGGAGIAVGEARRFGFPDGGDVLQVNPSDPLTLNLAGAAVATAYTVDAYVFGRVVQP